MVGKSTTVVLFFFFSFHDFRKKMHRMSSPVLRISLWIVYEDLKLPCAWNYSGKPIPQFLSSSVFGHLRQD